MKVMLLLYTVHCPAYLFTDCSTQIFANNLTRVTLVDSNITHKWSKLGCVQCTVTALPSSLLQLQRSLSIFKKNFLSIQVWEKFPAQHLLVHNMVTTIMHYTQCLKQNTYNANPAEIIYQPDKCTVVLNW